MRHDARDRHVGAAQAAVGFEPERAGRDLRLHVGAPGRVALRQLRVDRVVSPHRGGHAPHPHHSSARRGERRKQLARQREVAEHVGGEDELVAVPREGAPFRRMHDAGIQQHAVERAAAAEGGGGGAQRAGVAGVDDEGLDRVASGGLGHPAEEGRASRGETSGIARRHDHVRPGPHEVFAREVAETRVGTRDEVRPAGEVGEMPLGSTHTTTLCRTCPMRNGARGRVAVGLPSDSTGRAA